MSRDLPPPPAPAAAELLHRLISRLRRRAALSWSGTAIIAAVAVDLGYDLANLLLEQLTGKSLYFPVFFPVALAVFCAVIVRRTRPAAFCRSLDDAFALKDRLAASERYRRTPAIPAAVIEAQASETLARIDPQALAGRFAFRPWLPGSLLLVVVAAWVGVRVLFPSQFIPRSPLVQQGQALIARVFRHPAVDVRTNDPAGRGRNRPRVASLPPDGAANPSPAPAAPPPPKSSSAPVPPTGPPPKTEQKKPEEASRPEAPPQKKDEPVKPPAGTPRKPGQDGKSPPADPRATAGAPQKPTSVAVGKAIAPLGVRPEGGLVPPMADLKTGGGTYLPPVPLFRLLGKGAAGVLLDPETLYVLPDTWQPRYREHLTRYFEKLQKLGEQGNGS